jgi:cullin 1
VNDKFYTNIRDMLQENLRNGVKPALSLSGDDLVSFYVSFWKEFSAGAKHNSGVLMYMSRHYVMRLRDEGVQDVFTGKQLHAVCWKTEVYDKLENELRMWVKVVEVEEDASRNEKSEGFKECYDELREELTGSGKEILPWDRFCGTV